MWRVEIAIVALVLCLSLVAVFGAIYYVQWQRFCRLLATPVQGIAPDIVKLWNQTRVQSYLREHTEVVAAGGISTGHALYHLSQIDPAVLQAVDRVYEPAHVNSFRELVNHLEEKRAAGSDAWMGAVHSYKGHFGETVIAEQLRVEGHHVELHSDPSFPASDALVDGQPTQFKSGLSADTILEHRANYPDTPVITVAEHANRFADDPMVECLETVSGQAIIDSTSNSLESTVGIDDFFDGIPIATAIVSGFRHLRPVLDGDSDISTALQYTAADVAGVGVGAAAGAKAGALLGCALGPVGAAVGGVIGGIGGAIGGRFLASAYKNRDLDAAREQLFAALEKYPDAYVEALRRKSKALEKSAKRLRPRFRWASLIRLSIGDVVRSQGSRALLKWAKHCAETADRISAEIAAARKPETTTTLAAVGNKMVTAGVPEQAFSGNLLSVTASIRMAGAAVTRELKKLGQA